MPDTDRGIAAAPWEADPLGYLLGAIDPARFFAEIYEREAFIAHRDDPARYAPLISLAAIDAFIAAADLREGDVDITQADREIPKSRYVNQNAMIDRGMVVREYQRGATVILPQRHQSDALLAGFCRGLERLFSCHVQTNIYLTPPGSQGFPAHYDNHDVFVLQVEGAKHWRLYHRPVDTPYRGEGFRKGDFDAGEPLMEFVLKAGEAAYVPRGLMHDAVNVGGEGSLHVTVGLIVKTWADVVLEAVSELALAEPAFRRSLPPGHAAPDWDRAAMRAKFARLTAMIADRARMDGAFDLIVDQFLRSREGDVRGALLAAHGAIGEGRWRARAILQWRLAEEPDKLLLIGPGGDMEFAPALRPALERALSGEAFAVAELPGEDVEDMARRLVAFGLIERV